MAGKTSAARAVACSGNGRRARRMHRRGPRPIIGRGGRSEYRPHAYRRRRHAGRRIVGHARARPCHTPPVHRCARRRRQRQLRGSRGLARPSSRAQPGTARQTGAPPDLPRSLRPAEADLGANFEAVRALDPGASYPGSFLSGRFASIEAFTTQGRASILDAYGYRPPPVAPAAEVLDRFEGPDFIREKVLFSTTPQFRVPAYVHIPKGLTRAGPGHRRPAFARRDVPLRQGEGHRLRAQPPGDDDVPRRQLRKSSDGDRAREARLRGHHDRRLHVRRAARADGRGPGLRLGTSRLQRGGRRPPQPRLRGQGVDARQDAHRARHELARHRRVGRHADGGLPAHQAGGRCHTHGLRRRVVRRLAVAVPLGARSAHPRGVRRRLHVHDPIDVAAARGYALVGPLRAGPAPAPRSARCREPECAAAAARAAVPSRRAVSARGHGGGGEDSRQTSMPRRESPSASRAGSTTSRTSSTCRCRRMRSRGSTPSCAAAEPWTGLATG